MVYSVQRQGPEAPQWGCRYRHRRTKGEESMELKGTKTEKNLWEAFAGESQARNKYTYFASMAKKEGYEQLAAIFEETAGNEKEHAKIWFKLLCGGAIPDTLTCLDMTAEPRPASLEKAPRLKPQVMVWLMP